MKKWYFCALMMGSSMSLYSMDQELVMPNGAVTHDDARAETIIDVKALEDQAPRVIQMTKDELRQVVLELLQQHDQNRLTQEQATRWGRVLHFYVRTMPITTTTQVLGAIVSIIAIPLVWYH